MYKLWLTFQAQVLILLLRKVVIKLDINALNELATQAETEVTNAASRSAAAISASAVDLQPVADKLSTIITTAQAIAPAVVV